jgi:hypothetical protein
LALGDYEHVAAIIRQELHEMKWRYNIRIWRFISLKGL